MKKLYLLCLVAGMAISVSAEQRLAKQTVMVKDTIDLSEPQYGIDEVESYFYTSGGVDYCTYYFFNYDQEFPEYRVEVKAASRDKIQGMQDVVVETFSYVNMESVDKNTRVYFTNLMFFLKFTHKNIDGDSQYDILAVAEGTDGKIYKYSANMPIYAYEKDEINGGAIIIKLMDEVDNTIIAPEIPVWGDDTPTALTEIQTAAGIARKVIENGNLYILMPDGTRYTATGLVSAK